MEQTTKFDKGSGSGAYPYTYYGNNYGGYGGNGGSETTIQRGFQDYMLILRERVWYIVVVFLLVLSSVGVYTFTRPVSTSLPLACRCSAVIRWSCRCRASSITRFVRLKI